MSFPLPGYPGLPIEAARTQEDAEGAIAIWSMKQLLVTRASGKMTVVRARMLEDASESMKRRGEKYATFHDWELLTDYEIEARVRLVALGVRFRGISTVHMLVQSRVIVAAAEAARAVLKDLTVYKTRPAFEAELASRLRMVR